MKRSTILSLLLVVVLLMGAGLGTYAWFTSEATTQTNTFTAGTLRINANNDPAIKISLPGMQPGDVTEEYKIIVKNDGSLDAALMAKFKVEGALSDNLSFYDYKVEYYNEDGTGANRNTLPWYHSENTNEDYFIKDGDSSKKWANVGGKLELLNFEPLDNFGGWDLESLPEGAYYVLTFKLQYDKAATVQAETATLKYEVKSTQVNEEAIRTMMTSNGIDGSVGVQFSSFEGILTYYK